MVFKTGGDAGCRRPAAWRGELHAAATVEELYMFFLPIAASA